MSRTWKYKGDRHELVSSRDRDTDHAEMTGTGPLRDLTPRMFSAMSWDPFIEYVVFDADALRVTGDERG